MSHEPGHGMHVWHEVACVARAEDERQQDRGEVWEEAKHHTSHTVHTWFQGQQYGSPYSMKIKLKGRERHQHTRKWQYKSMFVPAMSSSLSVSESHDPNINYVAKKVEKAA
ncbi:hypothetical protein F5148DRAFT_1152063 [Russula earlei]|uniref:Uncharacterized protein n=1 Tax=Russula earlei TaxID=71964 RepID=A0ACC0TZ93_9AGAM|nr:hypothetical protein F5148DRAFT_1152063 [Russula earlei]